MTYERIAKGDRRGLIDGFGRKIDYLRVSVTDRCNFRCLYCMCEGMEFLPKSEVLSLDEMDRLCSAFVTMGVCRLRLTGGEPLVRKGILSLIRALSRHLETGALDELTLTTNGSQLARFADDLKNAGLRRINVSLDTLDPAVFSAITRRGDLAQVLAGIDAALHAGLMLKLNAVVMQGVNDHHIPALMGFAHDRGMDLTLIETMPLGAVDYERRDFYVPLSEIRDRLSRLYTLEDIPDRTSGPSRYVRVRETGGRLGFVTPMSHGFCATCNRVRVTCTGQLALCLGREVVADLRTPLRLSDGDEALRSAIQAAIAVKPVGHEFAIGPEAAPSVLRTMSVTGG